MQFTSYQKRAGTWALIAALVALTLWLLAPVLMPFVVAAALLVALRRGRDGYLASRLYQG